MNKNQRVVVTAYGLVTPLGHDVNTFSERMFAGDSGVISIRGKYVHENFPVPYAAVIDKDSLPTPAFYEGKDRAPLLKSWLMTSLALERALKDTPSELKIDAIVYGTADGVSFEIVTEALSRSPSTKLEDHAIPMTYCSESSLTVLKETLSSMGFNSVPERNVISINSACASGNQAIGTAFQGIKSGRWNRCIVGGVDARCEPSNFLNFNSLGALTTDEIPPHKASRPFSKDRSGFVRGEGAAILMLETLEEAQKRNAVILGEISGYGFTSDSFRLTDGRDDAASVIYAMEEALRSASMDKSEIQYINAHGTSTPLNDRLETFAIKKVFGERAFKIPVSSLKSQIGHSTIASSAIEAVACLIMLKTQKVAPTLNYNPEVDPDCDLDYVPNQSREVKLTNVMSNSFGFGGQNACVIFSGVKP